MFSCLRSEKRQRRGLSITFQVSRLPQASSLSFGRVEGAPATRAVEPTSDARPPVCSVGRTRDGGAPRLHPQCPRLAPRHQDQRYSLGAIRRPGASGIQGNSLLGSSFSLQGHLSTIPPHVGYLSHIFSTTSGYFSFWPVLQSAREHRYAVHAGNRCV